MRKARDAEIEGKRCITVQNPLSFNGKKSSPLSLGKVMSGTALTAAK